MPPVQAFRSSLYLSLAIAILAIGVAGGDLLPELPYLTVFCLLLLGGIYLIDGRWQLSLRNANLVGLGLAVSLGVWAIFQVVRPPIGLAEMLPWPASALPYLAPVLMVLIPAKLLRPKHIGDFWTMHGLGMLGMALACALAMEGLFVLIFIAYSVVFVWSLTAFHMYREMGPEQSQRSLASGRWRGLRSAVLWAALAGIAAIPLFWATPRTGAEWELAVNARGGSLTGLGDGPIDLNKTGTINVNSEMAFEFYANTPNGEPYLEMPLDTRFRGIQLHSYKSGRWERHQSGFSTRDRATSPSNVTKDPFSLLPTFGPKTVYLTFVLHPRLSRTPPIVDPVVWKTGRGAPVFSKLNDGNYRSWVHKYDGSFDGAFNSESSQPQYVQSWAPPAFPGEGPTVRVLPGQNAHLASPGGLGVLKAYTDRLIERLVNEGVMQPAVLSRGTTVDRLPEHQEAIARALEQHLANSGEFSYSLDLTRQDRALDPAEDFLINTKSGHCQRFATALTLMLRSQGIRSQIVMGYRGCMSRGDGWYEVHEDQAHAWVEALLPAKSSRPLGVYWDQAKHEEGNLWLASVGGSVAADWRTWENDYEPYSWVTLDPTPGGGDSTNNAGPTLLSQARQKWEAILKALLLAYNRESRDQAMESLRDWLMLDDGWVYLFVVAIIATTTIIWRRRARSRNAQFAGFPNLVRRLAFVLMRRGHNWLPGQTAREFAEAIGAALAAEPATASVANVPAAIVSAYYAQRFGDWTPTSDDIKRLETELQKLEQALS